MSKSFPKKSVLWKGTILGGIVNAVMTAQNASYAHYRQWACNHYVLNGGDGTEGVVTFVGGHWFADAPLVGVFFYAHSPRSPFHCEGPYELERFFRGCPAYQRSLADQFALRHLEIESGGKIDQGVTAAFWDEDEYLAAADPWDVVLENGADILRIELIEDLETALAQWQINCGMSPEQMAFARSLFERKMARPAATILLDPAQVEWLEGSFKIPLAKWFEKAGLKPAELRPAEQKTRPEQGEKPAATDPGHLDMLDFVDPARGAPKAMDLCRKLFAEMGILMP